MSPQDKPKVEQQKLGELLEKLVDSVGGGIKLIEATYASMKVTVYSMGPGRIRIDIKE